MSIWVGLIALGVGLGSSFFLPVPQTLKTNFAAGQSLYALGEYEGAIEEYTKIVGFSNPAVRTDSVRVAFGDGLELPVVAAAWYQLGNAYKRSGQHDEAVEAFQHVTTMESVAESFRSLVQFQVAETRFLQKQYPLAAAEYKRYVSLFPNSELAGQALFYAGWSEFNDKRYDPAIETLTDMLARYPEDRYAPDSQFRIASSHYEKENFKVAVVQADIVLQKYPNSPVIAQATYLRAQSFDKLGRDEDAITAYRNVRDLYDRMFELLRGSFRERKNVDFENYRQLFETSSLRVAEIYRREGKFEEAYQELITAQETAEERFYKAKVQMRLGDNYMEWKRFNEAYTAYHQVIDLYSDTPYPPIAQYNKGEARYFADDFTEARTEYLLVSENYPDSETGLRANATYSAAWSSEKLGDFETSLQLYAQVVASFPRSDQAPLCLLRMGRVNTEQQRFDAAVDAYQQIADNYSETDHAADANYGLGLLYKQQDRPEEAIEVFSRVGRSAGEVYVASLVEAANIHIGAGRSDDGRQVLGQLLAGVTGDRGLEAAAHYQIAQLDLNNGNFIDAINGYNKVIDEYPEASIIRDARYGRALSYHKANRFKPALADYQWLLDQNLPESMKLKVVFAKALSHAALNQDAQATTLLRKVIDSGDETLGRNAQLQLISMAEKRDPQDAIRIYEDMLASLTTTDDKVRVLIRLASAYFRLNQFDKSIEASQQLIDVAVGSEDVANALFVQGNSYFRSGDLATAVQTYQGIVDNYPQIGWARNAQFQIGVAFNKMAAGNISYLPQVAAEFEQYYNTYPDDERAVYAYYYAAFAYYRLGKWRQASDTFDQLAGQFPQSEFAPQAMFRAGESIFNLAQGRGREAKKAIFEEAMAKYEQVLSRFPSSDMVDDALYNKAWAIIHLSDLGEEFAKHDALPLFEQIVTEHTFGDYGPASQFTIGDYYYGEKAYTDATNAYTTFLATFSQDKLQSKDKGLRRKAETLLGHLSEIEAYNVYAEGEKFFDVQDYDTAVTIFQDVIARFPQSDQAVNAAVNIAAAFMAQEDYRKAGEEFQRVVDNYSGEARFTPQVDFARQQLEALEEARVI